MRTHRTLPYVHSLNPAPSFKSTLKLLKSGQGNKATRRWSRQLLDLARCGLQDKFVFHAWTCFLIMESYIKFIMFNTNILGHHYYQRGIISVDSVVWGGIATSFVYFWYLIDP